MKSKLNVFVLRIPICDDDGCTFVEEILYHYPDDGKKVVYLEFFKMKKKKVYELYDLQVGNG